jgi:hypothetical protein
MAQGTRDVKVMHAKKNKGGEFEESVSVDESGFVELYGMLSMMGGLFCYEEKYVEGTETWSPGSGDPRVVYRVHA